MRKPLKQRKKKAKPSSKKTNSKGNVKMEFSKTLPYPHLYSAEKSPLTNAWLQAQEPRIAEIMAISSTADAHDRVNELVEACVRDGIKVDEALVRGHEDVDIVMAKRVKGKKKIYAFHLEEIDENLILPISTNPEDFAPFDYAEYLAAGGKPRRQLWIQDITRTDGTFAPATEATAYPQRILDGQPPTGAARQAYNIPSEYVNDTPGMNGAIVRTEAVYGFRILPGKVAGPGESERRFTIQKEGHFIETPASQLATPAIDTNKGVKQFP